MKHNALSEDSWIKERISQPFKQRNIKYIKLLNDRITEAIAGLGDLKCRVEYKNNDATHNYSDPTFYYNYGSPAPYLAKVLPDGYGFDHFTPNDIYKNVSVQSGIRTKLLSLYNSGYFTRYPQPKLVENISLPENYILVTMQNTKDTVWYRKDFTILANDIVAWSRENRKNVIFKWHNGCIDHSNPERWFSELTEKSEYASIDYKLPLSVLIKNCTMLWTASSMSGIEALICNKPVSIFGKTEYMEMATCANNPDEAFLCEVPVDLDQWLTYYVNYYCINIINENSVTRIKNRILNYTEKGMNLYETIVRS